MSLGSVDKRYTSYAQNFEDVMLWRALGHVSNGFYIDVGAQHPIIDSVSKVFYEHGWRGIHVEPTPSYAALLRQDRPDEIVLEVALAEHHGTLTLYEIPETGLSTADEDIANSHRERGFAFREVIVPCITLADVFALVGDHDIHWLKIDVEGLERQVLQGWEQNGARPWIVVVESTLPFTEIESHDAWESQLVDRGYAAVYFDGLNRFYVSEHHKEATRAFRVGPNVFDHFELNGTASATFCSLINSRLRSVEENWQQELVRLSQAKADAELLVQRNTEQLRKSQEDILCLTQALDEQGRTHLEHEQTITRQHEERERTLAQQLEILKLELRHIKQKWAAREKALSEQTYQVRQVLEGQCRALAMRELEFKKQLSTIQETVEQEEFEQTAIRPEHETTLLSEVLVSEDVLNHKVRE